jgi:hypothetical protein
LAENKKRIDKFLESTKSKTSITHKFDEPVGISLPNGSTEYVPASKVLLVLIKDVRLPEGYFLLTGFPEL